MKEEFERWFSFAVEETYFDNIKDRILLLDRFYIVSRYPDAIVEDAYPKEKEAEEALEAAEEAIKIAIKIKMGNQR